MSLFFSLITSEIWTQGDTSFLVTIFYLHSEKEVQFGKQIKILLSLGADGIFFSSRWLEESEDSGNAFRTAKVMLKDPLAKIVRYFFFWRLDDQL